MLKKQPFHTFSMTQIQRSHMTLMCSHNDADSLSFVVSVGGDKRPMYRPKGIGKDHCHFPAKTTDSLGAHVRQYDFVILSVCVQVGIQVCTG